MKLFIYMFSLVVYFSRRFFFYSSLSHYGAVFEENTLEETQAVFE